ncbi:STAS domain-containing protein [Mycobacterium sp. smrl_JER01]|uniref:STAS domain-containing protein n=1 Tax=Mycobacterium sp. smrl_JER01 TaxID=3402633 RepID=UPI003AC8AF12
MTDEISNPAFPPGRSEVTVTTETVRGAVVVSVSDVVDAATAPEVGSALDAVFDGAPPAVVVDLNAVTFLASAGMTVLVQARERAGTDIGFAVVAATAPTRRPLTLLGLDSELSLCSSVDEALGRLS